jgi:D-alanyl-D-alanine carboxypeptidase (penicillin-binding protein 5/6)
MRIGALSASLVVMSASGRKKMTNGTTRVGLVGAALLAAWAAPASGARLRYRAADTLVASAAVVMDLVSGQTIFAKNPDSPMYPASTTKVMTAILVIESGRLDETVTVGAADVRVSGTRIGLAPGERVTLRDLTYGLLLSSGNDAAQAIARNVAGSQERFVTWMNVKAIRLGCNNTHFVNPHGLPDPEHYTTARDLGRIMRYAMTLPEFRRITATRLYTSRSSWAMRNFYNKNKLLARYPGTTGGKPGYTHVAQQTLVASARRADHELVVVCLHSQGRALWTDAMRLFDLGFRRLASTAGASDARAAETATGSR